MSINREYYHKIFNKTIVNYYAPLMTNLMFVYYQHSCENSNTNDECLAKFRSLLEEKLNVAKENPTYAMNAISLASGEMSKLIMVAVGNYKKLNSTNPHTFTRKISDTDIFLSVYSAVNVEMHKHAHFFVDKVLTLAGKYDNNLRIEKCIYRTVERAVDKLFELSFINDDRIKIIDSIEIHKDGKALPIEIMKLIDILEETGIDLDNDNLYESGSDEEGESESGSSSDENTVEEEEEDDESSSSSEEGIVLESLKPTRMIINTTPEIQ